MDDQILDDFKENNKIPDFRKSAFGFVLGVILFLISVWLIINSPSDNGLIWDINDYYVHAGGILNFFAFIVTCISAIYLLKSFYSKEHFPLILKIILFIANIFLCLLSALFSFEYFSDLYLYW